MKLLVNVFWPAWEWGPMNMPDLGYISDRGSPRARREDRSSVFEVGTLMDTVGCSYVRLRTRLS
jgi:hypothetical protein